MKCEFNFVASLYEALLEIQFYLQSVICVSLCMCAQFCYLSVSLKTTAIRERMPLSHMYWLIVGVIGCIDSSHISVKAPRYSPTSYVNRKGFHSIIADAAPLASKIYINPYLSPDEALQAYLKRKARRERQLTSGSSPSPLNPLALPFPDDPGSTHMFQ